MSELCEIAEALGTGASSCPNTEVVVMVSEVGTALSGLVLGFTLGLTSSGAATSAADPFSYALLYSTGVATSTTSSSASLTTTDVSTALAQSTAQVTLPLGLTSSANATSTLVLDFPPPLLTSIGTATSSASPTTEATRTVSSSAEGFSVLTSYLDETPAASIGVGASSYTLHALTYENATSTAAATSSTPVASLVPTLPVLTSVGVATSTATVRTDWTLTESALGTAVSAVYFKDPGLVAWVMNTETSAVSWYDNFDFQSIAQVDDSVFGVNSEGIFLLSGGDDAGDTINASIRTGFQDFGTAYTKRFENVYLGYLSEGALFMRLRVKDSEHPASTYSLQQRNADAPRTNRFEPGKGLFGRYWQVEIGNVNGAPFTVYDMDVDLAISNRKI